MTTLFIITALLLGVSVFFNWYLWQRVQLLANRLRSIYSALPRLLIIAGIVGGVAGKLLQNFLSAHADE